MIELLHVYLNLFFHTFMTIYIFENHIFDLMTKEVMKILFTLVIAYYVCVKIAK